VGENTRFVYGLGGELITEFDGSSGNLKKEYISGGITIEPTVVHSNGTQYWGPSSIEPTVVHSNGTQYWSPSWGQTCDSCDFGFGSPGCGVCAPLFQQAGGHLALTTDLAERLTIKSNSRALSFYV